MTNISSPPPMRFVKIQSAQCRALVPEPVDIEVLKSRGLSQLVLTGLPDAWLKDSRDKLRALSSQFVNWGPFDRVLIHLLPADQSKNGAHLEFAILVGCILALSPPENVELLEQKLSKYRLVGSLTLQGVLQHTAVTRPLEMADPDFTLGPSKFSTVSAFWDWLVNGADSAPQLPPRASQTSFVSQNEISVEGRYWERLWLMAAAVTEGPVLLVGPPGVGKSHLARWAARCLPPSDATTRFQTDQVWSLAGRTAPSDPPVLNPHSRTHISELMGTHKSGHSRPGWFSLAHGGTLILDEFPEMNRDCRETLRTVLDQKVILRQSPGETLEWPARFWLIATANPCPCGYSRGEDVSRCLCTELSRRNYQARMSGPLLDRFMLKFFVRPEPEQKLESVFQETFGKVFPLDRLEKPMESLRQEIQRARETLPSYRETAERLMGRDEGRRFNSERERQVRIRLLMGMAALTGIEPKNLPLLVLLLKEAEQHVFGSRRRDFFLGASV